VQRWPSHLNGNGHGAHPVEPRPPEWSELAASGAVAAIKLLICLGLAWLIVPTVFIGLLFLCALVLEFLGLL
jgi:hypothetical protein